MPSVSFLNLLSKEVARVDFIEPQLNLLAHAQAIELEVGSRCGGHGVCGGDRVRVPRESDREFLSPLTELERGHLSEHEIQAGFRLACQCFPNSKSIDLQIEILGKNPSLLS